MGKMEHVIQRKKKPQLGIQTLDERRENHMHDLNRENIKGASTSL